MWSRSKLVTVVIQPSALYMQWFEESPKKLLIPRAWDIQSLDALQVEGSIVFNLTFFVQTLAGFLKKHALKNAFVSIGLGQGMVWEQLRWATNRNPNFDEGEQHALTWNSVHVVSDEDVSNHLFYLFGSAREVLFQYQLLAFQVPCKILCITSQKRALLHVTSFLHQTTLPSPLFSDELSQLSPCCTALLDLFGYETLFEDSLSFKEFFQHEKEAVYAALGLFLLGKE